MRGMLLTTLLMLPLAVQAGSLNVKPGLWETTQKINGDSHNDFDCMTPEEARDSSAFRKEIPAECKLGNVKESATAMSFEYRCDSPTQTGTGKFDLKMASPTQYQMNYQFNGQMKMGGKSMPMAVTMEAKGRWVSADCGEHAD
ncbi:MAG: DUF3617 domain-containing protein [Solimonas sp.]